MRRHIIRPHRIPRAVRVRYLPRAGANISCPHITHDGSSICMARNKCEGEQSFEHLMEQELATNK